MDRVDTCVLSGSNGMMVKQILMMDLFLTNMLLFASVVGQLLDWSGLVWITCGLLCYFYQLSF